MSSGKILLPQSQEFLEPPTDPDTEIWNRMNDERLNKAYPCQYCGMSFSQNWLLKVTLAEISKQCNPVRTYTI